MVCVGWGGALPVSTEEEILYDSKILFEKLFMWNSSSMQNIENEILLTLLNYN